MEMEMETKMTRSSPMFKVTTFVLYLMMVLQLHCGCVEGRLLSLYKPDPNDVVAYARWLVAQNSWGSLRYFCFSTLPTLLVDWSMYRIIDVYS